MSGQAGTPGTAGIHGAGGISGLLASVETGTTGSPVHWYFYDANGNVGQVLDATNLNNITTVARYEYDPYGNTLAATGTYAAANPFRFSTKWFDTETGLSYYGYRYYNARLGRWMSRDPIQEKGHAHIPSPADAWAYRILLLGSSARDGSNQETNVYEFVQNSAVDLIDAVGEITISHLSDNLSNVKCGEKKAFVRWDFELTNETGEPGYFVQKVEVRCAIKGCGGKNCPIISSPVEPDFTYYEAWYVEGHQKKIAPEGLAYTDEAYMPVLNHRCGNYSQVGTVRFYTVTDLKESYKPDGDIGRQGGDPRKGHHGWYTRRTYGEGLCKTSPRALPSVGNVRGNKMVPAFWSRPSQEADEYRSFTLHYDCCCKGRETVVAYGIP